MISIKWGALGDVALVSFAGAVVVVALVSFALVGLSARVAEPTPGTLPARLGSGAGTAIAGVCILAAVAIVVFAILVIAGVI